VLFTKQELAHLAIDTAEGIGVSPALVCSIIEISSAWNAALSEWEPETWLLMNHPLDFPGKETEYQALGTRWGLMQFLGSKAKHCGYKGKLSAELGEPKYNLEAGCTILKKLMGDGTISLKAVLINWYGPERRSLVAATLAVLPRFQEFVAARPSIGKAPEDQSQVLPWRRQPKNNAAPTLPK
jgi:hypothetical protein